MPGKIGPKYMITSSAFKVSCNLLANQQNKQITVYIIYRYDVKGDGNFPTFAKVVLSPIDQNTVGTWPEIVPTKGGSEERTSSLGEKKRGDVTKLVMFSYIYIHI